MSPLPGGPVKALLAVLALDVGLAVLLLRPSPAPVLHPLVPPLTRVSALRDRPLALEVPRLPPRMLAVAALPRVPGAPDVGALRAGEQANSALRARGTTLRLAIEAEAQGLAALLGPELVAASVANREALGERYGEGRLWRSTLEALSR